MTQTRRQASLETNLCRKGLWSSGPVQLELPLDGLDLLGLVRASGRLKVSPDLEVLAWLTDRWRRERHTDGWVGFSLYELTNDLYGRRPSGPDGRVLREALRRLLFVVVDLHGYDAQTGELRPDVVSQGGRLIDWLVSEQDDLGPDATPEQIGALRGSTFRALIPEWMRGQIAAGHVTYLDWSTLRRLDGLAKRLWVYLEAEQFRPLKNGAGSTWLKLGDRTYTTLGMNYAHERQARAALKRACVSVIEADGRYERLSVERRPGGWAIVAHRLSDAERARVRAAIRASLTV